MGGFRVNLAVVTRTFRSATGPAASELRRRQLRVENRAKVLCPVDTGRLRSSITHSELFATTTGIAGSVGTNVVYAAAIHEGKGPRSWRRRAPRPRPFLRDALPAANPNRIDRSPPR